MELPKLYVEGSDDVAVVSNLLRTHGIDTDRGSQHLLIHDCKNDQGVIDIIADTARANTAFAVGFVLDIDKEMSCRWDAIRAQLQHLEVEIPTSCPADGYRARLPGYPKEFGIWLMPDCVMERGKLEDLVGSLIPDGDPLWLHARNAVDAAIVAIDRANEQIGQGFAQWSRFSDGDRIKADVRTWLAWQREPGAPLGAAINYRILKNRSDIADKFLRWLGHLFGFPQCANL
jgi:hypothetical protein